MTQWLSVFKHLLPTARAWRLTSDKVLRRFFEGLTGAAADVRSSIDAVYLNLFPATTQELDAWEHQFALRSVSLTEAQRRARLDAAWKAQGGQSPRYIQDTLRAAGFDVYVHEWWVPGVSSLTATYCGAVGAECGEAGAECTQIFVEARNPFDYLDDGASNASSLMSDGDPDAQDGGPDAQDGASSAPAGYPLVNKIFEASNVLIGDGGEDVQDGGGQAQDGALIEIYGRKQYTIPADATKYPYFLYIGGEVFPEQAEVPETRREEFEDLCLKISPAEQWLGILVTYS